MAVTQQVIMVGSNGIVGSVTVDPAQIMGEGGPVRPRLVVPISVTMRSRQADEGQLAVTDLTAGLSYEQHAQLEQGVCAPIRVSFLTNMSILSQEYDHPGLTHPLRFPLTWPEIADLERHRHERPASRDVQLHLSIQPTVVGLQSTGMSPDNSPFGIKLGLTSFMSAFWTVRVSPLAVGISQETWVERVLPGLGYDRQRLVEVSLPPPMPDHGSAAHSFDLARQALDQRRYGDCVAACRGLVNIWTAMYKASAKTPLGEVVGDAKGWTAGDDRRSFLSSTWNAVIEIVNSSHHVAPEDDEPRQLEAAEARLIFMMVVSLSEYLGAAAP